jgi:excisionase family DNA binding protein
VDVELLRLAKAGKRLGVHPMTLRQWAIDGRIPFVWVGRERRFSCIGVENMKRGGPAAGRPGRGVLYVRGCGLTGPETSLQAREDGLRATASGERVVVVRDRGSGLLENRPGLNRVLRLVADGCVTVVRVTREDRLARFGIGWLRQLFAVYGVEVEVLHPKKLGGRDELLADFVSLVTTFAGRLYGMRSAGNRRRLLAESGQCPASGRVG